MSHVSSVKTIVKDVDALEECINALPGLTFKRGQSAYRWWGTWVDDSPVPEGLFTEEELARVRALPREKRQAVMNSRLGRCEHAIGIAGSKFEIGVVKRDDGNGYVLLFDWYGEQGVMFPKIGGKGAEKIVQGYAVEKVKSEVRKLGGAIEDVEVLETGDVRIRALAGY